MNLAPHKTIVHPRSRAELDLYLAEIDARRRARDDKKKQDRSALQAAKKSERQAKAKAIRDARSEKKHRKNVRKCLEWHMVSPAVWTRRIQAKLNWYNRNKKTISPPKSTPCVYVAKGATAGA